MNVFLIYLAINSPQNTGYSYGLGYISSVLKQKGHTVDYRVLKDKRDIIALYEAIKEKKPKLIGFSATTSQFNYLRNIVKTIKSFSHAFIVCGGIHVTLKPDCILEVPGLDAIVRGEGEYPMLELANALENSNGFEKINNFWFKEKNGIIKNEIRPLIKNLDELPFPDKSSLDYQRVIDKDECIRYIFSRGCIFECTYCSNKALSNLYKEVYFRSRSPQKAIEEISLGADRYKFHSIVFDDDTISLNKDWFYEFFSSYRQRFKYPFACNIRSGTINSDMVKLLKEAGNTRVVIGVEHGNEEFRKTVLRRNITNKQMIEDCKLLQRHGIRSIGAQIMTGLPFENKELFIDTVRLCRLLPIGSFNQISIFQPYPGTELGEICRDNNWLPDNGFYRERENAAIGYPKFSKKEIQLCHDIFPFLVTFKFIPLNFPLGYYYFLGKISSLTERIASLIIYLRANIRLRTRLRLFVSYLKSYFLA